MKNLCFWMSRKINYPLVGPDVMQISLTYRCNLKCKMCSIVNLLPKEEELSTQQVFGAIDAAKNYGIKEILLTGGEPFLREDIFEICGYIKKSKLRSIITTNGTFIDNALACDIMDSKVSHIHISLDGLEETNDFFRGPGAFKKILNSIDVLNKRRSGGNFFSLGVACTVMEKNVKDLYNMVKFADDLNIDVINFQPLAKDNANFMDNKLPDFWISEENVPLLAKEIGRIKGYRSKHITIYEEPRLELLVNYYKNELSRKDWVCYGGFKTVFICYSKSQPLVYTCHGICGNLDKISLEKAWTSGEARALRKHSRNCRNLCMQSCYSLSVAQSLGSLFASYIRKLSPH